MAARDTKKLLKSLEIIKDSEENLIYVSADTFHVIRFLDITKEYWQDIEIYTLDGLKLDGRPAYHKKGDPCYPSHVELLSEGEIFLIGRIKWDGCSHINFSDTYFHGCSRQDLLNIGEILAKAHDKCIALMGREDEQ